MTDQYDPLTYAMILDRCTSRDLPKDPTTGLYIADGTTPPTEFTLPQYEAALKVLDLRDHPEGRR